MALSVWWGFLIRFLWERQKLYARLEPLSLVRLPYILFAAALTAPLSMYFVLLMRMLVTFQVFLALLYFRLPRLVWLHGDAPAALRAKGG